MVRLKQTLGNALNKLNKTVNLIHMIDMLERQHAVSECLQVDESNAGEDEEERQRLCKEAAAACLKEVHEHCLAYIEKHPEDASYEEWIWECHPENVGEKGNNVDHRFYVIDSDHRIIWNSYCDMKGYPERKIEHI